MLIGQHDAVCPKCKGTTFFQVPGGKLRYMIANGDLNLEFRKTEPGFLCATVGCGLRSFTIVDIQDAERARRNGDAIPG